MFPFKRDFITKEEILKRFERLQAFEPKYSDKQVNIYNMSKVLNWFDKIYYPELKPKTIVYHKDNYHKIDEISDWFIEPFRIKAKRFDTDLSMEEYWEKHKDILIERYKDPYELREQLSIEIKEVGTFRPTNIVSMIKEFKPNSILDFSSGWGDRLIGALACNIDRYVGVDPNTDLQDGYKEIIKTFVSKTKVTMNPFRIEDFETNEMFDMIFTSPPYFDLEIYSDNKTQSHHYGSKWYEEFLLPAIQKVWSHLNEGGHMIIIINDKKPPKEYTSAECLKESYVKKMIRDVNLFKDSLYFGVICYGEETNDKYNPVKSPQPMWIWKKQSFNFNFKINDNLIIDYIPDIRIRGYKYFNTASSSLFGNSDELLMAIIGKLNGKKVIYSGRITNDTLKAFMFGLTIGKKDGEYFSTKDKMFKRYIMKNIESYLPPDFKIKSLKAPPHICEYFKTIEGDEYIFKQMNIDSFIGKELKHK